MFCSRPGSSSALTAAGSAGLVTRGSESPHGLRVRHRAAAEPNLRVDPPTAAAGSGSCLGAAASVFGRGGSGSGSGSGSDLCAHSLFPGCTDARA